MRVNGEPGQLNTFVESRDVVEVDGEPVRPQGLAYVLLHKPAGVVTTARDPQGRPTVVDLVRHEARVVPVGRLDADTTGVLLLTNDGPLAHRLAHPRYGVQKVYEAEVEGDPDADALARLRDGVELDDGPTAPAGARRLGRGRVELTLHEGRKHQVKRMLAAVGHPVRRLRRTAYAGLRADGLEPGRMARADGRRAVVAALVAALTLAVGEAAAHEQHGIGRGYVSTVAAIEPNVLGVSAFVVGGDDRLLLRNLSGRTIVVRGYDGEPYLRISPDGVDENTRSPATYLNRERFPRGPAPAADRSGRRAALAASGRQPARTRGTTGASTGCARRRRRPWPRAPDRSAPHLRLAGAGHSRREAVRRHRLPRLLASGGAVRGR